MNIFRRYLEYRLKNSILRMVIMAFVGVLITQNIINDEITRSYHPQTGLYSIAFVLCAICTLVPILETAAFKNRRNLDTLYFFPIKRRGMAAVHFISGFLQVFLVYTVTYILACFRLLTVPEFANIYLLPYYFCSLLIGFLMYSFFIFIFGQANTEADGIIFCAMWALMPLLVLGALYELLDLAPALRQGFDTHIIHWGSVYKPIDFLTTKVQMLICPNMFTTLEVNNTHIMFLIWIAVGIACTFGYFYTFEKKGAQKAGEISNSWFGYKLLIPTYGYSLLIAFDMIGGFFTAMTFVMMVVGYIIYRRGFKFKPSDIILTVCGLVPLIIASI